METYPVNWIENLLVALLNFVALEGHDVGGFRPSHRVFGQIRKVSSAIERSETEPIPLREEADASKLGR